jgi:hypothetical protein
MHCQLDNCINRYVVDHYVKDVFAHWRVLSYYWEINVQSPQIAKNGMSQTTKHGISDQN